MQTETTRFTCDAAGCEAAYESEEYIGSRPDGWMTLGFDIPRGGPMGGPRSSDLGVRHFCSWDHVGQWVNEKIEKEREQAERRRKEEESRPARVVQSRGRR